MEHVRIDEGYKRGKKIPQRRNNNPIDPETKRFLPLIPRDDDSIRKALTDHANGATLAQIADHHGVSAPAIYAAIYGDVGAAEHEELVTRSLTARIAQADQLLDTASDPLNLARAREQARLRRMDLERRRPRLYGPKNFMEVTDNTTDFDARLRRALERVSIDVTPSKAADDTVVAEMTHDAAQQSGDSTE
jgi:hypothetical protein